MTITRQEIESLAEEIVNFTRDLLGARDPAEIRLVIDRAFEIAKEAVDSAEAAELRMVMDRAARGRQGGDRFDPDDDLRF